MPLRKSANIIIQYYTKNERISPLFVPDVEGEDSTSAEVSGFLYILFLIVE